MQDVKAIKFSMIDALLLNSLYYTCVFEHAIANKNNLPVHIISIENFFKDTMRQTLKKIIFLI